MTKNNVLENVTKNIEFGVNDTPKKYDSKAPHSNKITTNTSHGVTSYKNLSFYDEQANRLSVIAMHKSGYVIIEPCPKNCKVGIFLI